MTDDEKRIAEAVERYHRAAHAMQSGVTMDMNYCPSATEPKHLRVGVNSAMSDTAGLAALLIKKGLITEAEYTEAMADQMELEQKRYEKHLSKHLNGREVTLK